MCGGRIGGRGLGGRVGMAGSGLGDRWGIGEGVPGIG